VYLSQELQCAWREYRAGLFNDFLDPALWPNNTVMQPLAFAAWSDEYLTTVRARLSEPSHVARQALTSRALRGMEVEREAVEAEISELAKRRREVFAASGDLDAEIAAAQHDLTRVRESGYDLQARLANLDSGPFAAALASDRHEHALLLRRELEASAASSALTASRLRGLAGQQRDISQDLVDLDGHLERAIALRVDLCVAALAIRTGNVRQWETLAGQSESLDGAAPPSGERHRDRRLVERSQLQ
jgi:uncharacterized protein (DUF3084 family)